MEERKWKKKKKSFQPDEIKYLLGGGYLSKGPRRKKKKLLLGISMIGIISIMLVISYAFIAYYTYQKEINIKESNCIKIEFEDLTEAINLTNVYPMTDEAGERTKPYRFSIRNQCNVGVDYSINLEVLKTENRIPSSNIAVKIDQNIKQILMVFMLLEMLSKKIFIK